MKDVAEQVLSALTAHVVRLGRDLLPEAIDPDEGLLDAGYVDSIAVADLVVAVEQDFGVVIDGDRLLGDLYSLRALAEWIVAQKGAS